MGAAGVARTTRSAANSSGSRVDPATSSKPDATCRSSRTVTSVRTANRPEPTSSSGNRPRPPAIPANTGTSWVVGISGAWASTEPRSAKPTSCGTVARADSSRACPAYTPPSSGSTSRSVTSLPNRRETRSPTEMSPSIRSGPRDSSSRALASPGGDSTPEADSWSRSSGAPISDLGSVRSSPRVQIRGEAAVGWTTSIPSARARSTPSGRRLSIASAPTSTVRPATSCRRSLPPTCDDPSRRSTSWRAILAQEVRRRESGDASTDDDGSPSAHPVSLVQALISGTGGNVSVSAGTGWRASRPIAMTNSRTNSRVRRLAASAMLATLAVAFTGCSGTTTRRGRRGLLRVAAERWRCPGK